MHKELLRTYPVCAGHYSDHMKQAQTKVRIATYGQDGILLSKSWRRGCALTCGCDAHTRSHRGGQIGDLGQSSWMTISELKFMMQKLVRSLHTFTELVGCRQA